MKSEKTPAYELNPETKEQNRGSVVKEGESYLVRFSKDSVGIPVPEQLGEKMMARLKMVQKPEQFHSAELDKELDDTNCYGAVETMFEMPVTNWVGPLIDRLETKVPYAVYETYEDLKHALTTVTPPVVLVVGMTKSHAMTFLGFDETGTGVVFDKENLSKKHPWRLLSLEEIYYEYCNNERYKQINGIEVFVAKP